MTNFELHPNAGWGQLIFGMLPENVIAILGKAESEYRSAMDGTISEYRAISDPVITYSDNRLQSIGIGKQSRNYVVRGVDAMQCAPADLLGLLLAHDSNPVELVGSLYFPAITVACDGFYDFSNGRVLTAAEVKADDFRSITASAPGSYNSLQNEMRPLTEKERAALPMPSRPR
jgi:hypothetical protein